MTRSSSPFVLEGFDGRRLHADLTLPERAGKPLVVMTHGLMGFKDWGFFPSLAERFAADGFPTLRYNLSGSGMGAATDGPYTDLAAFEADTITRQVEDLHAVVQAAQKGSLPGLGACDQVILWGHSRGGGVSLLAAVGYRAVVAVATWATISRVNRYKTQERDDWRRLGVRTYRNGRTGQELRSSVAFLDDLEKWGRLGDIPSEAFRLRIPILLAHGEADVSVKVEESESLARALPTARLVVVAGADHAFGCRHPFEGPSAAFEKTLEETLAFFRGVV